MKAADVYPQPGGLLPVVVFWVQNVNAYSNIHAAAQGDSGGPLYWVDSAGRRQALGIVSMGRTEIKPCTTLGIAPDRALYDGKCFAEIGVTPINRVLDALEPWGIVMDVS